MFGGTDVYFFNTNCGCEVFLNDDSEEPDRAYYIPCGSLTGGKKIAGTGEIELYPDRYTKAATLKALRDDYRKRGHLL